MGQVGGGGLERVLERYRVTTDKASGIVDDPHQWGIEHGQPHYILDLVGRIVTVSVATMPIVDALPPLRIRGEARPIAARGKTRARR